MKIEAKTIEELIQKSNHPEFISNLDQFIQAQYPDLKRFLLTSNALSMIGYGEMTYQGMNELGGYWPVITIGPQKNNVSLYIEGEVGGVPLLEEYTHHFPKSSVGKGCIRFRNESKVDYKLVKDILDRSYAWHIQKLKESE